MGEVHTEEGPKADILVLIEGRARYLAHLGHVKTPEILRGCAAEITRLRVALAEKMVVKVKPLVWEPCEDWKVCSKERAPAFGGEYQMVLLDPKDDPRPSLYFEIGLGAFMFRFEQGEPDHLGPTGPKKFPTFAAAKAAAQADYTARILSAVDPDEITSLRAALADAHAAGFAAGVEAAAKVSDDVRRNCEEQTRQLGGVSGRDLDFERWLAKDLVCVTVSSLIRALTPPDATAAAARVLLADEAAMNILSDYEHRQWAGWFKHQLEQSSPENIERWKRQADMPFTLLSDDEKAADRRFADAALRAIAGDTP